MAQMQWLKGWKIPTALAEGGERPLKKKRERERRRCCNRAPLVPRQKRFVQTTGRYIQHAMHTLVFLLWALLLGKCKKKKNCTFCLCWPTYSQYVYRSPLFFTVPCVSPLLFLPSPVPVSFSVFFSTPLFQAIRNVTSDRNQRCFQLCAAMIKNQKALVR